MSDIEPEDSGRCLCCRRCVVTGKLDKDHRHIVEAEKVGCDCVTNSIVLTPLDDLRPPLSGKQAQLRGKKKKKRKDQERRASVSRERFKFVMERFWAATSQKNFKVAEKIASDQLDVANQLCCEGVIPDAIDVMNIYHCRAVARENMKNHEGAIADYNECLSIVNYTRELVSDNHYENQILAKYFWHRGLQCKEVRNFKRAWKDHRACLATLRHYNADGLSPEGVVASILELLTREKLHANETRPFFSKVQRDSFQKELGLGIYKEEVYKCSGCGSLPKKTTKLSLCSGCQSVWFCSKACLRASWSSHKENCRQFTHTWMIGYFRSNCAREEIERIYSEVDETGVHVSYFGSYGCCALVRDEETGRLFDALSDVQFYFTQDEVDEAIESGELNRDYWNKEAKDRMCACCARAEGDPMFRLPRNDLFLPKQP